MEYLMSWYWDKGHFREKNEDSFSMQKVRMRHKEAAFLIVCDGIGGLPEGETAGGFVTERMTEWFYKEGILEMRGVFWRRKTADSAIFALSQIQQKIECCERAEEICCGTTCTLALVKGGRFIVLHSGDSRAYLIGKREKLLTCDHRRGGALIRCMGAFGFQPPDKIRGRLKKGEALLLCTDGFCRLAPEGFWKGCLLAEEKDPGLFYKRLKGAGSFLASQGEKDNMTALLLVRGKGGGLYESA